MKIVIIGRGNVGHHLFKALKPHKDNSQGNISDASAQEVELRSSADADIIRADADIYILAVKDDAVIAIAKRLSDNPNIKSRMESCRDKKEMPPIIASTSGSVSLEDIISQCNRSTESGIEYGVLYPIQTFTKGVDMRYSDIPFFIEYRSEKAGRVIHSVAELISNTVIKADSDTRGKYHIASVIACNFTNRLYALADEYLSRQGLDFKLLLPLIRQTIKKLNNAHPADLQTGPAARGDESIIHKHLEALAKEPNAEELTAIYSLLTESIQKDNLN